MNVQTVLEKSMFWNLFRLRGLPAETAPIVNLSCSLFRGPTREPAIVIIIIIIIIIIITIIYPLTAKVVWAPQMTSQPASSIFFFSVFHCPLGFGELQVCPFLDVVFPPLLLSALSSSPFHCASQDGFCQTWWTGNMSISLQFTYLYDGQEVFM